MKPKHASMNELRAGKEMLEHAIRALRLLAADDQDVLERVLSPDRTRYSSLPAQQAVAKFLRDHPDESFRASEVAKGLVNGGFRHKARDFTSQIGVTLNRLARQGVAERVGSGKPAH